MCKMNKDETLRDLDREIDRLARDGILKIAYVELGKTTKDAK